MVKMISYFALNEWKGKCNRTKSLWKRIYPNDKKLFPFSLDNFDWNDYIRKFMIGLRIYLLDDPLTTLPAARIRRSKCDSFNIFNYLIYHLNPVGNL